MSIMDKKPTKETELFRMWKVKKNSKEAKKMEDDESVEVDLGDDITMQLTGFNTMTTKNTKELMFAWKFKHNDKVIVFYNNKKFTERNKENKEKFKEMMNSLQLACTLKGYDLCDINETLKSVKAEIQLEGGKKKK